MKAGDAVLDAELSIAALHPPALRTWGVPGAAMDRTEVAEIVPETVSFLFANVCISRCINLRNKQ